VSAQLNGKADRLDARGRHQGHLGIQVFLGDRELVRHLRRRDGAKETELHLALGGRDQ
jgi:hypothetical protein